jgi:NADP-dependent 3-hydroxy acid dehydrogenase YdfG
MEKRVAVVTGASSGIGAELCKALGREGWAVVLAARRREELERVADEVGPDTLVAVTDVTQRGEVENLKRQAVEKFGRIDVWVNNAGQGIGRHVLELTEQDLDLMISINVKSVLFGMQAVIPLFQQQGHGHLINVSSFLGRLPLATDRSAYCAAKSAVNSLTANLRMDLRRTHPAVHVSLVLPGMVATDFARNALHGTPPRSGPSPTRMAGQTTQEVARIMLELIRNPQPEIYTNPASLELVRSYYADVGAFEARP